MKLVYREFLKYKFLNSLFLGLSVGSIFTIYSPLEPSIFSIGGIVLALGMLFIAKLYHKILNIHYFYKISLLVEVTLLTVIAYFLLFSLNYTTALIFYIGYQVTFLFGSYLVRAETIFLDRTALLSMVDVVKQKGYLVGLLLSYLFYQFLEKLLLLSEHTQQVYNIHIVLFILEIFIIFYLIKSFRKVQ